MPDEVAKIPRRLGKKNKPKDTKFVQQCLPSYRPVLNATTVFPWTLILGVAFVGLGILCYTAALASKEVEIDYTDCKVPNGTVAKDLVLKVMGERCIYDMHLEHMKKPVKFYYSLVKYYQNVRTYVQSRNDMQLAGDLSSVDDCKPLDYNNDSGVPIPIAPCGKIADSMFNDTFTLFYKPTPEERIAVPFTTLGMLHDFEQKRKFRNPKVPKGSTLCDVFKGTMRPRSWSVDVCEFGANDTGRAFENIDFQVWMKPAALPHFRKIYRYLDVQADEFKNGLPAGNYSLEITYNYPLTDNIKKGFIIAREGWLGPRNFFLGIAYLVVGLILIVLSCVLFAIHLRMRYKND